MDKKYFLNVNRDFIFSFIFSSIGIAILAFGINEILKKGNSYEKVLDVKVEYENLKSGEAIKILQGGINSESEVIVFFILNTKTCAPCFNEVIEYNIILKEAGAETILLFLDNDYNTINRLSKFIDMDINIGYGDALEIKTLLKQNSLTKDIFFYDIRKETIFYRRNLFDGEVTSYEVKVKMINKIFNYWKTNN